MKPDPGQFPRRRQIRIDIVCTEKGQHPSTTLGDLVSLLRTSWGAPGSPPDSVQSNRKTSYHGTARRLMNECVWVNPGGRANMRCNRCGRHVQWTPDKAKEILAKLQAAGIAQLDISLIPF
jgi:hypothetical protein